MGSEEEREVEVGLFAETPFMAKASGGLKETKRMEREGEEIEAGRGRRGANAIDEVLGGF